MGPSVRCLCCFRRVVDRTGGTTGGVPVGPCASATLPSLERTDRRVGMLDPFYACSRRSVRSVMDRLFAGSGPTGKALGVFWSAAIFGGHSASSPPQFKIEWLGKSPKMQQPCKQMFPRSCVGKKGVVVVFGCINYMSLNWGQLVRNSRLPDPGIFLKPEQLVYKVR